MKASSLVCCLDAIVRDDAALIQALTTRHPHMADVDHDKPGTQWWTNHFYMTDPANESRTYSIGLIVEDTPRARAIAKECEIEEYIYWGANTDPVSVCSAAKIVELMSSSHTWKWMNGALQCNPTQCHAFFTFTKKASTKRQVDDALNESALSKKAKCISQPTYDVDTIRTTFVNFMKKKIYPSEWQAGMLMKDGSMDMIDKDTICNLLIGSDSDKSYTWSDHDKGGALKEEALMIVAKAMFT